jgi:hypothetical protein
MKALLLLLILLGLQPAHGQNWQEWTQQNKTQIKYLTQQISGLKVYLEYAQKGYRITQTGLTTISRIKERDFELHKGFFQSLKIVNSKLASSTIVMATLARSSQIVREVKRTISGMQNSGQFTPKEMANTVAAFEDMLEQVAKALDELIRLVTSNQYELSDEARLRRMETICQEMAGQYMFCIDQASGLGRLAVQRINERVEMEYSKRLK